MTDPKSVQDAFADAANTIVEHAVELLKKGAHSAVVHDAIATAERLSRHVGEIEDHARMAEQHTLHTNIEIDAPQLSRAVHDAARKSL